MAFAKKKAKPGDPISDRARTLNDQIAALEAEIKRLDTQLQRAPAPRLRSTALPHGATIPHTPEPPAAREPIFEEINQEQLKSRSEAASPDQYNELGVRKYDLPALLGRIRNHLRGPTTTNPRLVNYLAAGGVHGLRPLRYEKRVARNRFVTLIILLFLALFGIVAVFMHR